MIKNLILILLAITSPIVAQINVLAISGSLRQDSLNTKLVKEAARIASENGAHVTFFSLKDEPIPFYDGDLEEEEGMPHNVTKLRQLMISSDLILIASPNYNRSLPGVLKNAFDWASRNEAKEYCKKAFEGKKFLLMSASPGKTGGVSGLRHLKENLESLRGHVNEVLFSLPYADKMFDNEGRLVETKQAEQLQEFIQGAL